MGREDLIAFPCLPTDLNGSLTVPFLPWTISLPWNNKRKQHDSKNLLLSDDLQSDASGFVLKLFCHQVVQAHTPIGTWGYENQTTQPFHPCVSALSTKSRNIGNICFAILLLNIVESLSSVSQVRPHLSTRGARAAL